MKKVSLTLSCGLLGMLLMAIAIPVRVSGQAEISNEKLVNALRLLNTEEYSYQHEIGRFASKEEMLSYLRKKGILTRSPIDLENPRPYGLAVTTSLDGTHYQITLKPVFDMNDKSASCGPAAFSDDAGVIFLGSALGCDPSTR
jgi:hypothetical protein